MARREPPGGDRDRQIEEIILAYIDQSDPTEVHGERRLTAFGDLRALGISDEAALLLLNDPMGTLRAVRSGAEGAPGPEMNQVLVSAIEEGGLNAGLPGDVRTGDEGEVSVDNDSPYPSQLDLILKSGGTGRQVSKPYLSGDEPVDPSEIAEVTMTMTPEQALDWLKSHPNLPAEQLEQIRESAVAGGPEWADVADAAAGGGAPGGDDGPATPRTFDEEVDAAVEAATHEEQVAQAREIIEAEIQQWQERNGNSQVPLMNIQQAVRDAGLPDPELLAEEAKRLIAEDRAQGDETPEEAGERLFTDVQLPEWVLQKALQLNGGTPLSPEQEQRLIEYVSLYKGGDPESVEQILPVLSDPSRENQLLVEAAVLGDSPDQGWTVEMPGGRPGVTISGKFAANLFENYGFNMTGLNRLARLVAMTGENVLPYADPADNLLLVASIMAGFGVQTPFAVAEERDPLVDDDGRKPPTPRARPGGMFRGEEGIESPDVLHPTDAAQTLARLDPATGIEWVRSNWNNMATATRQSVARYIASLPAGSPAKQEWLLARSEGFGIGTSIPLHPAFAPEEGPRVRNLVRSPSGGVMSDPSTQEGVQIVMDKYRQGFERYNDVGLAMVYVQDIALAERIASTGGDPSKLSVEDELRTWNIIRRTSGEQAESWLDLAPESPLALFRSLSRDAASGGGAGRVRPLLDQQAVKQQFAQMMEGLLLVSPSDEAQNSFAAELQRQLDAAEEGQQFDVSAKIKAFVQGQARYQELYGRKPAGLQDEEYLGMFRAAESDMLGGEAAATQSIEAGLRTGQYQATVGSIFGDKQFRGTNSRLEGRLAEAANIFQANT